MGYATTFEFAEGISFGDTVIFGDDAELISTATSYTKLKEIIRLSSVAPDSKIRISLDLKCTNPGNAYAKVYVNGIAVGAEHWKADAAYATFTDDITFTDFTIGDKIQVYGYKSGAGAACVIRNFRICGYTAGFKVG